MTVHKSLATLIVILGCLNSVKFSHSKSTDCEKLRTGFSNVSQSYLNCAIENSEPVQYCGKCGQEFSALLVKYNLLVANETCKVKYFNQDRLNILEIAYSNAQSLWNVGSCSNCYDWVEPSVEYLTQNESATTKQFFDDLGVFENCTKNFTTAAEVCSSCVDRYNIVNALYQEIKENTNDNICFDIKDAMNKTRLNWSHNLRCCKDRNTSLTAFIASSVVISVVIPFLFYTSFMFFGWRREQLLDPIDSDIQPSASSLIETDEAITRPDVTNLLQL